MKGQEGIEQKAMNKGIVIGSKFFTAFQRSGYVYDLTSGKWEKKIDMVPQFCLRGGQLYKIPKEYQKYIVETFVFDPASLYSGERFVLNARGKHPNVSGSGQVCIGVELTNKFIRLIRNRDVMLHEYINFITDIEEALKIINFDSSYNCFGHDTSVLIPVKSGTKLEAKDPLKTLRRV